jgi:hypothetical protein
MRYFTSTVGLILVALILAYTTAAVAADGWGTQSNGYGQYYVSNG